MVRHWGEGFWDLLTFGMQMCLILVTGHALATTPLVRRLLLALARLPRSPRATVALIAFSAGVASLINWGLGIITGALLAREVARHCARENLPFHYPMLGAAAYTGFMLWHGGLSGSAPLWVNTPGHALEGVIGLVPPSHTLFSPLNLGVTLLMLIPVVTLPALMAPRHLGETVWGEGVDRETLLAEEPQPPRPDHTPAARFEESRLFAYVIGGLGLVFLAGLVAREGLTLDVIDVNLVNFTFLFAGILLHGSPKAYVRAIADGVQGVSGIILQFPFYAGIMGMIAASGLLQVFADWIIQLAGATFLPVFTFFSAGLVNLFVPSGGGQWAIQGPIMVEAARELGVSVPKIVMAVAYGDEWTNMLQPFWALPLLGITGLRAREIVGYTMAVMLFAAPLYILGLLLIPS